MDIKEIMALAVLVFVTMLTISIMWKFKRMKDQRKKNAEFEAALAERNETLRREKLRERQDYESRAKMREHPNYSHARFDPKNPDVLKPRKHDIAKTYASPTQSQTVGNNSVGIQSQGSTTVVHDSSDLLTNVALWTLMNNNRVSSVSGTYDEDTGRVSVTTREEPKEREESSYTSSYNSSSSDDDDRKSSYSSSYSSSSSDDSYSSSSSDSSYSSSYSSD